MQKATVKEVKMLKIQPILINGTVDMKVKVIGKMVDFDKDEATMLDVFYKHIECDCIDIVSFGGHYNPKGYSVVVDDEGLLKSGNVVITYTLPIDGEEYPLDLAGAILIGKSDYVENRDEDGLYEVGLSDEDLDYIQDNLTIKLRGVTR